jgi:hypothetical protein
MIPIKYKQYSDFSYIPFKYNFNREENLNGIEKTFKNGLPCFFVEGLQNFQDTTYNKNTSLILSNTVPLSTIFVPQAAQKTPYSLILKTIPEDNVTKNYFLKKNSNSYVLQENQKKIIIYKEPFYLGYDKPRNVFIKTFTDKAIYIQPVPNTEEVEIFLDGKLIFVEKKYPYTVKLKLNPSTTVETYQQRFLITKNSDSLTLKTLTPEGYRYLSFNSDGILRATGCRLNENIINDYVFFYKNITTSYQIQNSITSNPRITYYTNPESDKNKTVDINKFENVNSNYLFTFVLSETLKNKEANINLVTLKNISSPTGSPYTST